MAVQAPSVHRLRIVVTCRNCGAELPVRVTARARQDDRWTLRIRTTIEPSDALLWGLFDTAHRGPFRTRSAR